jgi:hypothetical protein
LSRLLLRLVAFRSVANVAVKPNPSTVCGLNLGGRASLPTPKAVQPTAPLLLPERVGAFKNVAYVIFPATGQVVPLRKYRSLSGRVRVSLF